jgi:hypothetical protein
MHFEALGDLAIDRLQEREELDVAVPRQALADHGAGEDIERGETVS